MPTYTRTLNNGYRLEIVAVLLSQSEANNTSTIEVTTQLIQGGSLEASSSFNNPYESTVDGTKRSGTKQYNFFNYDALVLDKFQRTVNHSSTGTKTVSLSATFTDLASQNFIGDGTATGSYTLPTIPRASKPTVSPALVFGSASTLNMNRASTGFTHTVRWYFGTQEGVIATGVGASVSWTPDMSLLSQIPNAASGSVRIRVLTYVNGTNFIGETNTNFTITAPASVVPTVGSISHSEATSGVAANVGRYVQGVTKIAASVTGSAGIYGSTITATKIEVGGQTINSSSGTTPGVITSSGTVPLKVTVTDSRGRTATSTVNLTVLAWSPPKINSFSVQRANSVGTVDENGDYLRVNINASVSSLVNSTERNQLRRIISTAAAGGSSFTSKSNVLQAVGTTTFNSFVAVGTYSGALAYDVKLEIQDDFATTSFIVSVPVAKIAMHWNGNVGVGVGKYHQQGVLDVGGDIFQSGSKVVAQDMQAGGTASITAAVSATTGTYVYSLNDLGDSKDVTLSSGGLKVGQTGLYLISGIVDVTNSTANVVRSCILRRNSTDLLSIPGAALIGSTTRSVGYPTLTANLVKDDIIYLVTNAASAGTAHSGARLTLAKIA